MLNGIVMAAFIAGHSRHGYDMGQGWHYLPHALGVAVALPGKSYHRGSRRWGFLSPKPPPPPPRVLPRSVLGRASLTFNARPPESAPFSAVMALAASASSPISTNPNPRALPVSRSVTIDTVSTFPKGSKSWRKLSSVTVNAKFPTNIFFMTKSFSSWLALLFGELR